MFGSRAPAVAPTVAAVFAVVVVVGVVVEGLNQANQVS